jgi:hypothetical protein
MNNRKQKSEILTTETAHVNEKFQQQGKAAHFRCLEYDNVFRFEEIRKNCIRGTVFILVK